MNQYFASLVSDIFRLCIWLVLLAIVFVPLERLFSLRKQPIFRKELPIDLGYYFLNGLLPKLLLILPMSIVAGSVHHLAPGVLSWAASLSPGMRLLLTIFVGEFGTYWGHRWSHEIPVLWQFHAIHHSAREMDWLVNTRAHPLDMVYGRFTGLLPIYLVGLGQPTSNGLDLLPVLYTLIGTVWSFVIHGNISWRFGLLEKLIATPAFHHWHHANDGERYINKNYATILPGLDKLFGTFYLPKHRLPKQYGIDLPIATDFVGQLIQPLELSRSKPEN